ncbi:TPA: hypothetical protein EYP83_01870 [Candidatus Geothermarchaeota archaeon]|nr:hypothetical protein [Candidatus Geothermarchaeota archaeon]
MLLRFLRVSSMLNKRSNSIIQLLTSVVTFILLFALINSSVSPFDDDSENLPTFNSYSDIVNYIKSKSVDKIPIYLLNVQEGYTGAAYPKSVNDGINEYRGYSRTNVQVEGIDELDLVKTDGLYIYIANESSVLIIKAYPPDSLAKVGKIDLNTLFVEGLYIHPEANLLIVIGYRDWYSITALEENKRYQTVENKIISPILIKNPAVSILLYDLDDPSSPRQLLNITFPGSISGTRLYKSFLYINNIQPVYRYNYDTEEMELLLPIIWIDGVEHEIFPSNIKYIPDVRDLSFTYNILFSLDVLTLEYSYETILLGYTSIVYMSYRNFYIVQPIYSYYRVLDKNVNTIYDEVRSRIIRFSVNGLDVSFRAYGDVPGAIYSQFQLDEYNGFLRVSTTSWMVDRERSLTYTNLFILNGELNIVGSLTGIAKSERLYATRFYGDYAYLVTFRIVDPLFVVNMDDPANPYIEGELKIPGFSTYLHPISENLLIGIGYEVNNMTQVTGLKVSLFSVADPTMPEEVDNIIFNSSDWVWSEALYNHKAILLFENDKMIGFSITFYNYTNKSSYEAKYVLVKVSDQELRIIKYLDLYSNEYMSVNLNVVRGLYIDSYLYIINYDGIMVYKISDFSLIHRLSL